MGIAEPQDEDGLVSAINVTPLVDVMLVLLVIFMVTAPMLQQGVEVDLPKAAAGSLAEEQEPLILTVQLDGRVFVGEGSPVELQELGDKVKAIQAARSQIGGPVYVRADKGLSYGDVMKVMGSLHDSNITKVGLVTDAR